MAADKELLGDTGVLDSPVVGQRTRNCWEILVCWTVLW